MLFLRLRRLGEVERARGVRTLGGRSGAVRNLLRLGAVRGGSAPDVTPDAFVFLEWSLLVFSYGGGQELLYRRSSRGLLFRRSEVGCPRGAPGLFVSLVRVARCGVSSRETAVAGGSAVARSAMSNRMILGCVVYSP